MLLFRQRQQNHQGIGMDDYGNRRHTAKSYTCLQVWVFVMFRLNHENWKYKTKQIKVIQVHKKFCLNKIFAQTNFESKTFLDLKEWIKKFPVRWVGWWSGGWEKLRIRQSGFFAVTWVPVARDRFECRRQLFTNQPAFWVILTLALQT